MWRLRNVIGYRNLRDDNRRRRPRRVTIPNSVTDIAGSVGSGAELIAACGVPVCRGIGHAALLSGVELGIGWTLAFPPSVGKLADCAGATAELIGACGVAYKGGAAARSMIGIPIHTGLAATGKHAVGRLTGRDRVLAVLVPAFFMTFVHDLRRGKAAGFGRVEDVTCLAGASIGHIRALWYGV